VCERESVSSTIFVKPIKHSSLTGNKVWKKICVLEREKNEQKIYEP
jgi:hypothetical protein